MSMNSIVLYFTTENTKMPQKNCYNKTLKLIGKRIIKISKMRNG